MKHSLKKKWKRILSMMLAVALVLGLCQTTAMVEAANDVSAIVYSTVPTNGTDTTAPNLELTLKLLDKKGNSINTLGIDTNWDARFKPKDDESGLYRNGTRVSSDSSAYMYADSVNVVLYLNGYGTAYAGDVFTVKGSLYDSTRNQTITFAKPQSYMWSGTEWIRIGETSVKTLSAIYSGGYDNAEHIYTKFIQYDESSISDATSWSNRFEPVNGESGLFIHSNGTTTRLTSNSYDTRLVFQNGAGWGNGLYIPTQQTSDSLTEGDTLTIKGSFASPSTGESFRLQNEVTFTYNGTNWDITGETPYYSDYITFTGTLSTTGAEVSSTSTSNIYLAGDSGLDEYKINSNDDWTFILSAMEGSENGIFLNGSKVDSANLRKYNDNETWFFTEGFTASNVGDCLTIKGQFKDNKANKIVSINESSFVWNGSQWSDVVYDDITLTDLHTDTNSNSSGNYWEIYVNTTEIVPGTAWATQFQNVAVQTGDTSISPVTVNKTGDNQLNAFFYGTDELPTDGSIADGTPLTIKAGKYKASDSSHGIWIKADFTIYAKDGGFTTEEPVTYQDVLFTGFAGEATGFSGENWHIYLLPSSTLPGTNDSTHFTGLQMKVGEGEAFDITFNPTGYYNSSAFFSVPADKMPENLADGTKITILAGKADSDDGSEGINLTSDFVFYAKDGRLTTEEPVTYTDFQVTGLQSYLGLNAEKTAWNGYFTVDTDLPGTAWIERFPLTIDVDGVEATVEAMMGNNSKELYFTVPVETLPIDTDLTVTIKADSYACKDSNVRLGYTIASDFTFYASKHGWSTSDKILDVNVLKDVKAVVSDSQSWPAGFVINTNCEDGVAVDAEGWSSRIYPVRKGDSNGQTVYFDKDNGVKADAAYQDKKVPLIKIGENQYYVGLADVGINAETGVEYTVGGVFYDTDGKLIEFEPVTAVRNGETASDWMGVIKDTEVEGDINGDTFVDSCDLVRMLRYYRLGGKIAVNQERLDVNCDGNADVKDIPSLRKVLLGAIYYNRADAEGLANSPYGMPVYKRNQTIERTAYISPAATDDNFAKYKAAGFTLLETQNVARYKDESPTEEQQADVVAYLKKAQQYGLGVLVYSVPIHNMIVEADNDAVYYGEDGNGTMYKTILQEEVTFLKNYPAFKGFFLGDEVSKERVEQYNKVAAYLLELDPDLILFNSQLGLYNTNANNFSDTIADKKAAYLDYIDKFSSATNRFVYDTYTLEYEYNGLFDPRTYNVSEEWYNNLSYVAAYVKGQLPTRQVKTGVTIQACQPDITKPSHTYRYAPKKQADIGFQVYTALAYGMDEINYYKYEDHDGDKYASNFVGTKTEVYNAVKAVNAELDSFGHVFKAFSWKDTLDIAAGGSNKSTGNARLQSAASNGGRAFVGCMKDADGFDGYMVANAEGPRAEKTATVTLTFNSATKAMIYKGTSCETVSLTDGVCTVELAAGEGAFIIPIR